MRAYQFVESWDPLKDLMLEDFGAFDTFVLERLREFRAGEPTSKNDLLLLKTLWTTLPVSENCSVGGTGSGSVATVSTPIGGTVRRDGGTLLGGYQSSDEFPNTPDYIKKQAKKWRSSNKNN